MKSILLLLGVSGKDPGTGTQAVNNTTVMMAVVGEGVSRLGLWGRAAKDVGGSSELDH